MLSFVSHRMHKKYNLLFNICIENRKESTSEYKQCHISFPALSLNFLVITIRWEGLLRPEDVKCVTYKKWQQFYCNVITRTVTCYRAMSSTKVLLHWCGWNVTFHSTAMASLLSSSPAAKRTPLPGTTST
jgi:hypothetical protein